MNKSVENENFQIICHFLGTNIYTSQVPAKLLVNQLIVVSINGILMIPTIFLNFISIITILKSSQLKSKPSYFIILVQSVIDLAVGLFGIPIFLVYLVGGITGISNCVATLLAVKLPILPIGVSTKTSALTMERYMAIRHPYSYPQVTNKRILMYISSGAVAMFSVVVLSCFIPGLVTKFATAMITLVLTFIAFAYTRIYLLVRRLSRSKNQVSDENAKEYSTRKKLFLREIKRAKSCFIVVICFFILSFLPPILMILLNASGDKFTHHAMDIWVYTLSMSNSNVNSVIFFWMKTIFRKDAMKMLKAICTR